jgi:carnitine O-palmitoyltransferase 1
VSREGVNVEHSWADAPVTGHLMQYCQIIEYTTHGYNIHGDCKGKVMVHPSKPTLLKWDLDLECKETIASCLEIANKSIENLQLHLLSHDNFGKGAIKKCKLSPDAFVQMALQLSYYTNQNRKFSLTYEASMTRLFKDGRTETIRPCTIESSEWVKAMGDKTKSKEEKIALLRKACDQHTKLTQEAMTGQGIDRHLFCLYVISKYLEIESPFLTVSINLITFNKKLKDVLLPEYNDMGPDLDNVIACGGGFGPVVDDGYGISYFMNGENKIFFHISSSRKALHTDPPKMAIQILEVMEEMKSLFD